MARYESSLDGLRLNAHLASELEARLRIEAAADSKRYLERTRADISGDDLSDDAQTKLQSAVAFADDGGWVVWEERTVTGPDSIVRSTRGGYFDEPLSLPSLEGAQAAELRVAASAWATETAARVSLSVYGAHCRFTVEATDDAIGSLVESINLLLHDNVDVSLLPPEPTFKVFVGHGGDPQWKYLYKELNQLDGVRAEAFESEVRAGFHTLVVVDRMVRSSNVAVIVMTGEDTDDAGGLRARENVVHEVGFCQGALGIENTIVLLESGVSEPSNIAGLSQIRFDRGALIDKEAEILAAIEQRRQAFDFQIA
jgi:predicted nucleotide-binding protein